MHINDMQTVHTCQSRSVCKSRPSANIQRLIFEARFAFKAWALLVQLHETPGLYSRPGFSGLYLRPGLYSRKYGTLLKCSCGKWTNNAPYHQQLSFFANRPRFSKTWSAAFSLSWWLLCCSLIVEGTRVTNARVATVWLRGNLRTFIYLFQAYSSNDIPH